MKQKQLAKYIFTSVLAFSLFSVLYVNAGVRHPSGSGNGQQQMSPVEETSEQKQERDIPVPSVTVVSRILDIAQRLITYAP